MDGVRLRALVASCLLALSVGGPATARPDPTPARMALVIGNGDYRGARLRNPARDAEAVADSLRKLGFEVTVLKDAPRDRMIESLRSLYLSGRTASTRLVYFAGHGVQADGQNYLLPVDLKPSEGVDLNSGALNITQTIAAFGELKEGVNIFILDACRESPLARFGRSRGERGLAPTPAPRGSFVAFATHPGGVAADSPDQPNSLYTAQLLKHLGVPGQTIEQTFKRVRQAVSQASGERQVPWENSSLIGEFCFATSSAARCGDEVR